MMITPAEEILRKYLGDEVNIPIVGCVCLFCRRLLQRSELHCPRGFIVRNNTPQKKSCQSQPTGIYKCKIAISSRDDICLSKSIYSIYLRLHVPQVSGYHVAVSAE